MDLKIVTPQLDALFQEIRRRIHRLQSGGTIDSMASIGANTDHQIGASFVSLKQLAKRYTPNESLALMLWNEQKREEQIIACFLFPEELNTEKMEQLCNSCLNFEIAEYFGSLYLHKHSQLLKIATAWLNSGNPFLQTSSLTAISRYLILHKENQIISMEFYQNILLRKFEHKYVQLLAQRFLHNC